MTVRSWTDTDSRMLHTIHQWVESLVVDPDISKATHALLRLTWSTDVSVSRPTYDAWAHTYTADLCSENLAPRNAPDALRVAVAWWLKQPAFLAAKVIVRKTRATKRGAYLQLHVTEGPHEYLELVYLSCNEDGSDTKCLPGLAWKYHEELADVLSPRALIDFGQSTLFTRDLYTLGTHLLTQAGGTLYWPGVWRLPLEAAERVCDQLETLKPLLTSGNVTCELIPICDSKENIHDQQR